MRWLCSAVLPTVVSLRPDPPVRRFLKKSVTYSCFRYGLSIYFSDGAEGAVVVAFWARFMYFSKNFESSSIRISSFVVFLRAGTGTTSL